MEIKMMNLSDILNFSPTLYVGECRHGVYAIPSLADQYTPTVSTSLTERLLIDGASKKNYIDER